MTESMERRIGHDPVGAELDQDSPLASEVPAGEDVDTAQAADDVEQDPDSVPNRVDEPEPPRTERVEPADPPRDYDPLYDESHED